MQVKSTALTTRPVFWLVAALIAGLALPNACFGITAEMVARQRDQNAQVTLIDIRSGFLYEENHIPGAISVPLKQCAAIQLPPLGEVVVYGDGLDPQPALDAAAKLNGKSGIRADVMAGGISRWEALGYPTTRASGFSREHLVYVTYQQLSVMAQSNPDLVLVDLRQPPGVAAGRGAMDVGSLSTTAAGLTDLGSAFPGVRVVGSPFAGSAAGDRGAMTTGAAMALPDETNGAVHVLIDNGDVRSEAAARRLTAAGYRRLVILVGGEASLARRGQPGVMIRQK